MDRQIRVSPECHAALKRLGKEGHQSLKSLVAQAVAALHPYVVVAVDADGQHSIVEVYTSITSAVERSKELRQAFLGQDISISSRAALHELAALRRYGPDWIEATGWTPSPGGGEEGDKCNP